jgi:hypothetical protein
MVGAPATSLHRDLDWGFPGRASRAVARSWLWRGDEGGAGAPGRWPGRGKKRWHSPPLPLADHVAPCLLLAATQLNDSDSLYAMGKVQTAVQIPVQLAHWAFTAGHSRHYAAMKSHPPGVPQRPRGGQVRA